MSLTALIPKWTGSDPAVTLEDFLSSLEAAARIGHWQDSDKREIGALKLSGSAKTFYQGCTELHEEDATWQTFKNVFRRRYDDVHTDQYHFTRLQTARQAKGESPQEFADRCRQLAQKVMSKTNDPIAQRIHRENAERMLLTGFISGLSGTPGRQVRYSNPQSLGEALKIALSVQEAEKQERFNEGFYTKFDESVRLLSRSSSPECSSNGGKQHSTDASDVRHRRGQRNGKRANASRSANHGTRNAQAKTALRCYNCDGVGHFSRDCPTRHKREAKPPDSLGKRNPNRRSRRSCSPESKPSVANKR